MDILARNQGETEAAARQLAADIKPRDLIALHGDLGLGKTVFARALIRALTGDAGMEVPSPTFTLVQTYDSGKGPIWHFDLYRLEDAADIYELGWEEARENGIIILEWPQRLQGLLPAKRLDIRLGGVDNEPDQRTIQVHRT
jgi:tRNA threonylcarbamoyladenosine biosynthesis protein TsaE